MYLIFNIMKKKRKYKYSYPNTFSKYYKLKQRYKIFNMSIWWTIFKTDDYDHFMEFKDTLKIK